MKNLIFLVILHPMKVCNLILLFTIFFRLSHAQIEGTAVFGLQYEPVIPTGLFRVITDDIVFDDVSFGFTPQAGRLFGGHLGFNITNRFTFETGINMIRRGFVIGAKESNSYNELRFMVHNFEVPLTVTYYVRLGKNMYMGHNLGVSLQMLPSHLASRLSFDNPDGSIFEFRQGSYRKSWIVPIYRGGIGFEYRTETKGQYHIGPVYHLFRPLYNTSVYYRNSNTFHNFIVQPVGNFFGLLFRYNFPPSELKSSTKK